MNKQCQKKPTIRWTLSFEKYQEILVTFSSLQNLLIMLFLPLYQSQILNVYVGFL